MLFRIRRNTASVSSVKSGKTNLCRAVRATPGKRADADGTTAFLITANPFITIWNQRVQRIYRLRGNFSGESEPAGAAG